MDNTDFITILAWMKHLKASEACGAHLEENQSLQIK